MLKCTTIHYFVRDFIFFQQNVGKSEVEESSGQKKKRIFLDRRSVGGGKKASLPSSPS